MLTLEVCAHSWQYERATVFHLSAFALHPPQDCRLIATIFYATEDEPVCRVLDYFGRLSIPNVSWNFRALSPAALCRRAIGRNMACRESQADYLLLSDVDYLFGAGALDAAAELMPAACAADPAGPRLMFPRRLESSISHADGDAELARVDLERLDLIAVDPTKYVTTRLPRPIGGAQWLPGGFAREKGYLPDGHRLLRREERWRQTIEDRHCRGYWGIPRHALEIPNVWRIRHGSRGRSEIGCRN